MLEDSREPTSSALAGGQPAPTQSYYAEPNELWPSDLDTFVVGRPHGGGALSIFALEGVSAESVMNLLYRIFEDQATVLTDPETAEMMGSFLDETSLSFEKLAESIVTEDDIRSLFRISVARLLRETGDGIKATPYAREWADRWLAGT